MYFYGKIRNVQTSTINQLYRQLFTNNIQNNIHKQNRIMEKLLRKDKPKRGKKDSITINGATKIGPSMHVQRRMNVLNKVLMEHITDFMSTGELDSRLENKSIEITHVKITQDFKIINIYWIDNSIDKSDTEKILDTCAHNLRHELCQLYIMGNLPPIKFVKSKSLDIRRDVERKLAIADYGENYHPSLYPNAINHVVSSKSSTDSGKEITDSADDTFTVTLPIMRHDVFQLDHHRIMSKIKASLAQSRHLLKQQEIGVQLNSIPASKSIQKDIPKFITIKEQEEQFTEFLKKKQRERRLKYKEKRSMITSHDLIEENEDDLDTVTDYDYVTDDGEYTDR